LEAGGIRNERVGKTGTDSQQTWKGQCCYLGQTYDERIDERQVGKLQGRVLPHSAESVDGLTYYRRERGLPEMNLLFRRLLHMGLILSTVLRSLGRAVARPFRFKANAVKRASQSLEALEARKREELELERLDRLRHPSNYQGR